MGSSLYCSVLDLSLLDFLVTGPVGSSAHLLFRHLLVFRRTEDRK